MLKYVVFILYILFINMYSVLLDIHYIMDIYLHICIYVEMLYKLLSTTQISKVINLTIELFFLSFYM